MKPSLYLLIPALFLVSCDQQEVATYDECITQTMQGVSSDEAARAIIRACRNRFTSESQPVVEASRLVTRNDTVYEINSDTPFTGVSLTYHENGRVELSLNYTDGNMDGISESYWPNGTLRSRNNHKDGELNGLWAEYREDGTLMIIWNWKDGNMDGISEMYREDGTLRQISNYKDGELDGLWEMYGPDGTLGQRSNYKDGERLGEPCIFLSGRVINYNNGLCPF